jgi:DNA primase
VIDEIKARSELVGVVEQYVRLDKRSGSNYFGLCPFHSEDTPSFSVSPSKQIYYCFGCHKGGDVVHFIMDIEKCSYPQAVRLLAERSGVAIPESDDEEYRQRSELNKQLMAINLEAARYFYHTLNGDAGSICRQYMQRRGLQISTARKFGLGYAGDAWDGLYQHLLGKGFSEDLFLRSGLLKKGKNGQLYDLFRSRLMFPIMDVMGRVVAFGGRVLDDSQPKYINSPETPVYTKGRHLFALNLAKSSHEKHLVMVEGYMDAIALYQAGVDCAVASLGTALTENQAQLLRKYTESVIIAYDADAAGQAAALRSLDILGAKGIKVTVLQVPDGKDPDDYIRKNGPERFHALLEKALPLIDFKLLAARRANTTDNQLDLLGYQDAACQILAREDNAIVRELYAVKLAEELNATADTVLREIERRHQNPDDSRQKDQLRRQLQSRATVQPMDLKTVEPYSPVTKEDIILLCLLASYPDLWDRLKSKPITSDFSDGTMQDVAESAIELSSRKQLDTVTLIRIGENKVAGKRPLHELFASASMKLESIICNQDVKIVFEEMQKKQRKFRYLQLKSKLQQKIDSSSDEAEKQKLKEQLLEIDKQKTLLLNSLDEN